MSDADAWSAACEEDLAAEKARRRAENGRERTDAAEELRRLADAVTDGIDRLGGPLSAFLGTSDAQGAAKRFVEQATSAVEPVVERNPQVFDHLAAAGGELLAAYRAAVEDTGTGRRPDADTAHADADARRDDAAADPRDDPRPGPGGQGA